MEINSEYTNENAEQKQKDGRVKAMSDVVLARSLVQDIGGPGRVNEVLYAAYKRLQKMFPHDGDAHNRWTENRLKAWWYGQNERVYHFQMVELYKAAAKAKEERELLARARREHAEFVAKTARLAALIEHQDEAFHRASIDALRGSMGHVDLSRDRGD